MTAVEPLSQAYREALAAALVSIREGQVPFVPAALGLRRRRPRAHFHATPEFFVQTGGASRFECPHDIFELPAGRTCIIPAGVPHAESPRHTSSAYGIVVCMQARDGILFQRARSESPGGIDGYALHHVPSQRGRDAFGLLERVDTARHLPEADQAAYRRALAEAFLLTIMAELAQPSVPTLGSPLVAEAEKLALSGLSDAGLTVARIGRGLGCSADHLSREFKAARGVSLKAWITRERIALARDLLAGSRHQVAEVGWACGFARPSYFIRVFSAHTGVTPGDFRRRAALSTNA